MGHVHGVARPPRVLSAATSLSLSVLFVAVYGATAWLTSLRGDVGDVVVRLGTAPPASSHG